MLVSSNITNNSFRGLYGNSTTKIFGNDNVSYVLQTTPYFPFSDESDKKVYDLIHNSLKTTRTTNAHNITCIDESCLVASKRLKFTEAEYLDFCKHKIESAYYKKVIKSLKENNLFAYLEDIPLVNTIKQAQKKSFFDKLINIFKNIRGC